MKKILFKEKYPVYSLEVDKSEVSQKNVDEIIEYFKQQIEKHPIAQFIATFKNYEHTKNLGGEINPEILDAQNIIFCFGRKIPVTQAVAMRPRSIAICETKDKFVIEFFEAPNEDANKFMEDWAKGLTNGNL